MPSPPKKSIGEFQKKPKTFCMAFLYKVQEQDKLIYEDKNRMAI